MEDRIACGGSWWNPRLGLLWYNTPYQTIEHAKGWALQALFHKQQTGIYGEEQTRHDSRHKQTSIILARLSQVKQPYMRAFASHVSEDDKEHVIVSMFYSMLCRCHQWRANTNRIKLIIGFPSPQTLLGSGNTATEDLITWKACNICLQEKCNVIKRTREIIDHN